MTARRNQMEPTRKAGNNPQGLYCVEELELYGIRLGSGLHLV